MLPAIAEISEASTDETKFHNNFLALRNSQKKEKFDQKCIFYFLLYSLEVFQTNTFIISWKL